MKPYNYRELIAKNTQKYPYSKRSLKKLLNIDANLVDLLFEAANFLDLKIVQGYRSPEEQNKLYKQGKSTKDGYIKLSKHQSGKAVDVMPLPTGINIYLTDFENSLRWAYFTGFMQGLASAHNITLRTGWKWRANPQKTITRDLKDNTFLDSNHLEIKDTK